jgi:hypothetical protein
MTLRWGGEAADSHPLASVPLSPSGSVACRWQVTRYENDGAVK